MAVVILTELNERRGLNGCRNVGFYPDDLAELSVLGLIYGSSPLTTVLKIDNVESEGRVSAVDPFGFKIRVPLQQIEGIVGFEDLRRGLGFLATIHRCWSYRDGYLTTIQFQGLSCETYSAGSRLASAGSLIPAFSPEAPFFKVQSEEDIDGFVELLLVQNSSQPGKNDLDLYLDIETNQVYKRCESAGDNVVQSASNVETVKHEWSEEIVLWQVGNDSVVALGRDPKLMKLLIARLGSINSVKGIRLIGFNTNRFDLPIIAEAQPDTFGQHVSEYLDLMNFIRAVPYLRSNLDTLVILTLGKALKKSQRQSMCTAELSILTPEQIEYAVSDIEALAKAHDMLQACKAFAKVVERSFRDNHRAGVSPTEMLPSLVRAVQTVNANLEYLLSEKLSDDSRAKLQESGLGNNIVTLNDLIDAIVKHELNLTSFRLPDGYSGERFNFYTGPLNVFVLQSISQVVDNLQVAPEACHWNSIPTVTQGFFKDPIAERIVTAFKRHAKGASVSDRSKNVEENLTQITSLLKELEVLADVLMYELGRERTIRFDETVNSLAAEGQIQLPKSLGHLLFVRYYLIKATEYVLVRNPEAIGSVDELISSILNERMYSWDLEIHGFREISNPFRELVSKRLLPFISAYCANVAYGVHCRPGGIVGFKNVHRQDRRIIHAYKAATNTNDVDTKESTPLRIELIHAAEVLRSTIQEAQCYVFIQGSGKHLVTSLAISKLKGSWIWIADQIGVKKLKRAVQALDLANITVLSAKSLDEILNLQTDKGIESKTNIYVLEPGELKSVRDLPSEINGFVFDGFTPFAVRQLLNGWRLDNMRFIVLCPYYAELQVQRYWPGENVRQIILSPKTDPNYLVIAAYPAMQHVFEKHNELRGFAAEVKKLANLLGAQQVIIRANKSFEKYQETFKEYFAEKQYDDRTDISVDRRLKLVIFIDPTEEETLEIAASSDAGYKHFTLMLFSSNDVAKKATEKLRRNGVLVDVHTIGPGNQITEIIPSTFSRH